MNEKIKVYLTPDFYAVLTLKLEMPPEQRRLAESLGAGPVEQHNLLDQKFGELRQLLGNTDEA